jgi:hypothetical protein
MKNEIYFIPDDATFKKYYKKYEVIFKKLKDLNTACRTQTNDTVNIIKIYYLYFNGEMFAYKDIKPEYSTYAPNELRFHYGTEYKTEIYFDTYSKTLALTDDALRLLAELVNSNMHHTLSKSEDIKKKIENSLNEINKYVNERGNFKGSAS